MKKVFLGGTCNGSDWREKLKPMLKIDYFDPVVKDWTPECAGKEIIQRQTCDYCLYVITPKMVGCYAIAEVADDSNKRPEKTVFCYLSKDGDAEFQPHQLASLGRLCLLLQGNGATVCMSLGEVAVFLNEETAC